eukprot:1083089-Pelagomonas_calceolata.AAC.1
MDNLEPLKRLAPQHTKVGPSYTGSFRSVDVRHAKELTYEEFVHCYMEPNRPVLIQVGEVARVGVARTALQSNTLTSLEQFGLPSSPRSMMCCTFYMSCKGLLTVPKGSPGPVSHTHAG